MMTRILLVARNTFRAIMSRRAVYVWGLAVLLMFLRSAPAIFLRGDEAMMAFVRATAVSGGLETWSLLCLGAAILIGAGTIASEITSKTIVTMLSRPIRRWEVLAGKWLGVATFGIVSMALGIALAMGLARYLGIDVDRKVLAMAFAQIATSIVLFSGVAVVLSGLGSAVLAAAFTILLMFLPGLIRELRDQPGRIPGAIGAALHYATPPGTRSLYRNVVWAPMPRRPNAPVPASSGQPPPVDYHDQRKDMAKKAGYAGVYFVIGCFFFSRRDVKLA